MPAMLEAAVGSGARVLVVCLLLTSALEKLRSGAEFRQAIRTLGVRPVGLWWLVLCGAELATAALMVAAVPSWLPAVAVLGLGTVFALAGVRAIRMRADVACACFGRLAERSRLGRRQILALPLWAALAGAVLLWTPGTADQRSAVILSGVLVILVVTGARLARAASRARADRTALAPRPTADREAGSLPRINLPPTEHHRLGPVAAQEVTR
jgi:hypothetical protein